MGRKKKAKQLAKQEAAQDAAAAGTGLKDALEKVGSTLFRAVSYIFDQHIAPVLGISYY